MQPSSVPLNSHLLRNARAQTAERIKADQETYPDAVRKAAEKAEVRFFAAAAAFSILGNDVHHHGLQLPAADECRLHSSSMTDISAPVHDLPVVCH